MAEEHIHSDVLIVGAGIAGLTAARSLADAGLRAVVVEKEERVGGRLATLEMGGGRADHGAQFFTVRNPEFQSWVNRWLDEGLVFEWSRGWSSGSLSAVPFDGNPRYAIRGGMTALAEHLAAGLDVRQNVRLVAVARHLDSWLGLDEKGRIYTAPTALLTPPVPLALQLLTTGQVALTETDRAALQEIEYEPCLAGIFWLNGPVNLPEPGAVQRLNAPIAWIADNRRKGLSPEATVITVQAGASYSRELWRLPDWEALVALESGLALFKEMTVEVIEARLARWPYAMPIRTHPDRYLRAANLPLLVFAGDAFGSPRVEGAALSGLMAARALVAQAR